MVNQKKVNVVNKIINTEYNFNLNKYIYNIFELK